jgi:hypothetical protein
MAPAEPDVKLAAGSHRVLKQIGLTLGSVAVTLILVEIGFRVFAGDPYVWLGREVYPDNPRGYFTACEQGFCVGGDRSVHGCDATPAGGRADVLIVGDSFAWGQGVRAEDTFGGLLRSDSVSVRNCAAAGNAIGEVLAAATQASERHRPDALIYALVLNDFVCPGPMNATAAGLPVGERQDKSDLINDFINLRVMNLKAYVEQKHADLGALSVVMHSRMVSFFYRRWLMGEIAEQTAHGYRECLSPGPHFDQQLDKLAGLTSVADRVVVAIFPLFVALDDYPFEAEHRRITEGLTARGLEVIDLLDVYRGTDATTLIVHPTDLHPNDVAHVMAATRLRQWLTTD